MFLQWRKTTFQKGNDDKNSLLSTLGNKPFLLRVIQSSCPDPKELESLFNWLSSLPALEDFGPEYLTNSLVGILLHFFKHKTLHWGGNPRQLKSACVSTKDVWVLAEAAHCSAAPQKKKDVGHHKGPYTTLRNAQWAPRWWLIDVFRKWNDIYHEIDPNFENWSLYYLNVSFYWYVYSLISWHKWLVVNF